RTGLYAAAGPAFGRRADGGQPPASRHGGAVRTAPQAGSGGGVVMTAGTRNTKQTPSRSVRVVVVDDHALARAAVRTILGDDPLFEIVAEAADADGAFAAVQEHRPDLVLMDIRMPGGGLQATRRIKAAFPQVRIVMMTVSDAPQDLFEALRSGAQGYVLKNL